MKCKRHLNRSASQSALSTVVFTLVIGQYALKTPVYADVNALEQLMGKMEADVLELKRIFEQIFAERCSSRYIEECHKASYDACVSEFPAASCPGGELGVPECASLGSSCGGLFDYTVSSSDMPKEVGDINNNNNPLTSGAKDAICYSLQAESYMINKYNKDKSYWRQYGIASPSMFFGSDTGVFRIFPARHIKTCGAFDPRRRPWYVAASSGPKNVILVLDTSKSMDNDGKMEKMKDAAIRVIETLALGDYVAVVQFSESAAQLNSIGQLERAKTETKSNLINLVSQLEPVGDATNFYAGFELAFNILDASIVTGESSSGCNSAILFLTDGQISDRPGYKNITEVLDLVATRREPHEAKVFTYSFGDGAGDDTTKSIACATDGVWAKVDNDGDLAASMGGYYKYFAYGLQIDQSFTAWVEPYVYSTGNALGTTVSAPVYDTSVEPPVFIGVVGVNFLLSSMTAALGDDASKTSVLQKLVEESTAECPTLDLNECQIQALRQIGGEDALCEDQCQDLHNVTPAVCNNSINHPSDYWVNNVNVNLPYEQKVCCSVGETRVSGELPNNVTNLQCANDSEPYDQPEPKEKWVKGVIGVAAVVGYAFIASIFVVLWTLWKHKHPPPDIPSSKARNRRKEALQQDAVNEVAD